MTLSWPALILAFVIGGLIIAPAFYFRYSSGHYRGIDLFGADAEASYLAQIQEVYKGRYALASFYTAPQFLTVWMVGSLGRALGLSAPDVNLVTKFLFPFLLSLLVGALFYELTKQRLYALLAAAFIMLAPATLGFFHITSWWDILVRGNFPASDYQFLSYSRPINPQASSFFFYGYFLVLWKFLYGDKVRLTKSLGILSSIILGLSFYTYFFVFSFISVFTALLFFWFLLTKDFLRARSLFWAGLFALLIALPAFANFIGVMLSPFYEELVGRVGAVANRAFIFSKLWWGSALVFLLLYKKIKEEKFRIFALIFLATAFILTNQQVITGRLIPVPQHYHWYYVAPFAGALFLFFLVFYLRKFLSSGLVILSGALILMLFFWAGFLFQQKSYAFQKERVISEERYGDVLRWLNAETPQDASILANKILTPLIPAYTHSGVYYYEDLINAFIGLERFQHTLFVELFLDGLAAEKAEAYFKEHRNEIGTWLYGEYWRQQSGCSGCFPDEVLEKLVLDYKEFLKRDFGRELERYPLDYIVWDKEYDHGWRLERFFNQKIYEKDGILVYKI